MSNYEAPSKRKAKSDRRLIFMPLAGRESCCQEAKGSNALRSRMELSKSVHNTLAWAFVRWKTADGKDLARNVALQQRPDTTQPPKFKYTEILSLSSSSWGL